LRRAIDSIDGERLTLGQLVDALGRSGQGLVLLLLALPAFIPVPALPTGLVFGTALTLVAMQMIGGREALTLPDFLRQRALPRKAVVSTIERLERFMSKLDGVLRPRLLALTDRTATIVVAALIFILGLTLVLPIPFGNQGPAFAIVIFAFGLLERDGLAILVGVIFAFIGVERRTGDLRRGAHRMAVGDAARLNLFVVADDGAARHGIADAQRLGVHQHKCHAADFCAPVDP
jgi:hypothetical protein